MHGGGDKISWTKLS